jgi:hypothetical protein
VVGFISRKAPSFRRRHYSEWKTRDSFVQHNSPLGVGLHRSALRMQGTDQDTEASAFVYFDAFLMGGDGLEISATTQLSYWFHPEQEDGRHVAVDLVLRDGSTLRATVAPWR